MTREDVRIYAGVFAASALAVAKQAPLRDPPPTTLPRRLRPASLGDLPRLFHGADEQDPAHRVARLSSAALVYSVRKDNEEQPKKILRPDEKTFLQKFHDERKAASNNFTTDRSCPHCRLLYGGFFVGYDLPPVVVVNHSARVKIDFDPDTNISQASIKDFQVIVPKEVAGEIIRLSDPLRWAEITRSIFERSDPVGRGGAPLSGVGRKEIEKKWKDSAADSGAFLYERAVWPMNEELSALSENILRIQNFDETEDSISYEYSLERCIRSNFGIAWESSGLDIDGGRCGVTATPLAGIIRQCRRGERPLRLTWRDILEWSSAFDPADEAALFSGKKPAPDRDQRARLGLSMETECAVSDAHNVSGTGSTGSASAGDNTQELSEPAPDEDIANRLDKLRLKLESDWSELAPFYLVTVSANKAIHFTVPENGPIELWYLLTWTAPTVLFTFLNRAICHSPIVLTDRSMKEKAGAGRHLKK
jgi:hypothetical protein